MKYCPNCGKKINEEADYCIYCGKMINQSYQQNNKTINQNNKPKKSMPAWQIILIVVGAVLGLAAIIFMIFLFTFGIIVGEAMDNPKIDDFFDYPYFPDVPDYDNIKYYEKDQIIIEDDIKFQILNIENIQIDQDLGIEGIKITIKMRNLDDENEIINKNSFKIEEDGIETNSIKIPGQENPLENEVLTPYVDMTRTMVFEANNQNDLSLNYYEDINDNYPEFKIILTDKTL